MRIISKFRDYYDSAMAHGLDPARLYSRVPELHELDLRFWPGSRAVFPRVSRGMWGIVSPVRSLTLGFCGRHYPLWVDASWPFGVEEFSGHEKVKRWFTFDEAVEAQRIAFDGKRPSWAGRGESEGLYQGRLMTQHDGKVAGSPADPAIFRSFGCPIYVLEVSGGGYYGQAEPTHGQLISNPRLANFGFERVIDAFSAFQSIATFLDNELANTESGPNTVGGDEVVARSKGFDEQSFRTAAPGQKKLSRKAKPRVVGPFQDEK